MQPSPVLRFGRFELDPAALQLRRDGQPVPLRPRPFALLRVLVAHPGQVVRKEALLEAAWPGVIVEENNLQVQVSVLRKVLGNAAIATVPAVGYRFDLPVQEAGDVAHAPAPAASEEDLVGRAEDLARVVGELRRSRLVTITGPGGIGKTRLARETQHVMRADFSDGVVWVELGAIADPELVALHVLQALDPAHAGARAPVEAIARHLAERQVLLVLDNAEHVLAAAVSLAARLLESASGVRLLVTSQAPLRARGEAQVRLQPLALPRDGAAIDEARATGAVALFCRRAQACDSRFALDAQSLPLAIEVCRRLDGIPLAIELAAARVPAFGLRGVASLLDERFRVLTAGDRLAPARQQTLHAVYEWTYGLLSGREQQVFRRLGTVAPGATLGELVELLATPAGGDSDWAIYDTIGTLVERSLLAMDDGDPPRYDMLESARAFAREQLVTAGEFDAIARAAAWYEARGDRAAEAAGAGAALANYGAALESIRMLPEGAVRDARELELLLKLGPAVQATLGPSHPRCEAIYRRSVELARRREPGEHAFKAVWGLWQFLTLAGRDSEAAAFAREIVQMAPRLPDDGFQLEALHAEMTTCDLLGDARAVVAHARRITGMYDRCRHHKLTFAFGGHDPGVCALGQAAVNLWLTGQPQEARDMAHRALALASQIEHGYSRATGAYYASITFAALGDTAELARTAHALVQLSAQFGMEMLLGEGRFFAARAQFESGDAGGLPIMRKMLAAIEASGDLAFVFVYMALLGDALLATGELRELDEMAERALHHARRGQRLFLPEVMRLRAEARARQADARWRTDLETAAAMAQEQGAVAFMERIAASRERCAAAVR